MFEIDSARFYMVISVIWVALRIIRGLTTRKFDLKREILVSLLFAFLCFLSYRVFEPFRFVLEKANKPNLIPVVNSLKMIRTANATEYLPLIRIVQILLIGNLLIFVPIGLLAGILFKDLRSGWKMLLVGVGISLTIEILQLILAVRVFDVDDILLNALGTWLGYLLFLGVNALPPFRRLFESIAKAQRPGAGMFFGITALVVGIAFFGHIYQGWQAVQDVGDRIIGEPEGKTLLEWLRWLLSQGHG